MPPSEGGAGAMRSAWQLDPDLAFLNHGSFGATPRVVLDEQRRLRDRLEADPMRFMLHELPDLLAAARAALASFVGSSADAIGFVANATTGVNAVLRSLEFAPGDEILITNHSYGACARAAEYVANRAGATVVVADVPFPPPPPSELVETIDRDVTDRTVLAIIDHVTSPTALVFPIAEIVARLAARGVDTLVDGAHAPGMLPLDLGAIGAAYYAGNCHKWMSAPKGAGFLAVAEHRRNGIVPTTISHGYGEDPDDRFRAMFDWQGTDDPTPFLAVPIAIEHVGALMPGGWAELQQRNHELALEARDELLDVLTAGEAASDDFIGSMAAVTLPDADNDGWPNGASDGLPAGEAPSQLVRDPLESWLRRRGVVVPIVRWPSPPHRLVRVSVHAYVDPNDVGRLAAGLTDYLQ